ncbi:hypothetical protein AgCh_000163 [Apium graveolens]
MILASDELGCSEEILTITVVLSIHSIWVSSRGSQKELDEGKMGFAAAEAVPLYFSGKSLNRTPKKYMEGQNGVVAKYMDNPEKNRQRSKCEGQVIGVDSDDMNMNTKGSGM